MAYKFHVGEYRDVSKVMKELTAVAKNDNVNLLGIYYDEPKTTAKNKKRFAIGVCLNNYETQEIDVELEKKFTAHGYNIVSLPQIDNAVIVEHPLLPSYFKIFSMFMAIMRAYPRLNEFIQKKKLCAHPFIEFYFERKIRFVVPLSQQEQFYVREFQESELSDPYYKERSKSLKKLN